MYFNFVATYAFVSFRLYCVCMNVFSNRFYLFLEIKFISTHLSFIQKKKKYNKYIYIYIRICMHKHLFHFISDGT